MFICCKTNKYFKNSGQPAEKFVENFGRKWKKQDPRKFYMENWIRVFLRGRLWTSAWKGLVITAVKLTVQKDMIDERELDV